MRASRCGAVRIYVFLLAGATIWKCGREASCQMRFLRPKCVFWQGRHAVISSSTSLDNRSSKTMAVVAKSCLSCDSFAPRRSSDFAAFCETAVRFSWRAQYVLRCCYRMRGRRSMFINRVCELCGNRSVSLICEHCKTKVNPLRRLKAKSPKTRNFIKVLWLVSFAW